jgi:hypothetical protein
LARKSKASTEAFALPEIDSGGQSLLDSVDEALRATVGTAGAQAEGVSQRVETGEEGEKHEKATAKQP